MLITKEWRLRQNILLIHYETLPVKKKISDTSSMNDPPELYLSCSGSVSLQSAGDSVCFMSLRLQHHDSVRLRHSECHLMTLLHGQRNWADQPRWLLWISCLDCRAVVSATLHPLKFSKDCNVHAFRQLGAYLRRSTGLYLATSGCVGLIFLWTLSHLCNKRWNTGNEKITENPSVCLLVARVGLSYISLPCITRWLMSMS